MHTCEFDTKFHINTVHMLNTITQVKYQKMKIHIYENTHRIHTKTKVEVKNRKTMRR